MAGMFYDKNRGGFVVKMTPPYNTTGEGYYETNVAISGASGTYITGSSCTDTGGWLPTTLDGNNGTYYCDGSWYADNIVGCPRMGGSYNNGYICGPRATIISQPASYNGAGYSSSRLAYVPTKPKAQSAAYQLYIDETEIENTTEFSTEEELIQEQLSEPETIIEQEIE